LTAQGWLQIAVYLAVLTALTPLLGSYMARVYTDRRTFLTPLVAPVERLAYRALRVDPRVEQDWKGYARTAVVFSALFWLALYAILRSQGIQPFNPQGLGSGSWDLSFNTASSFVTNTNWQFYGGEATLSYFSQMAGLTVQNFVSAAVGMAVLAAVIRGFASRGTAQLGNFWRDLIRTLLYILLPLSFLVALFLVSQGVIQTLAGYLTYTTLAGAKQTLALGPVASQVAIKQLGTNGGGFFNVNSAMPFENPSGLSGFVEALSILLIPAGLTATFGRMVGNRRQGWALYAAMAAMLVAGIAVTYGAEQHGTPAERVAGIETAAAAGSGGGNMQDKEQRFGIASSAEWATATTAASNGSVDSGHDAYTGAAGAVLMLNMLSGEVIFGGVGSGLYGMLLFVLIAVFIAGLMVGRTPEYLGKKIEAREIKLTLIGVLYPALAVLVLAAVAVATAAGKASIFNAGPQGFSETLYAYASQGNNNGSAFAGYAGTTFAELAGGLAMIGARFVPMLAALAVAGSLATKRVAPLGAGTFRTDTPTFVFLLVFVVAIVAALTFFPALLLGPISQAFTDRLF
jgi:potassium-transporting ATPase potassium-binding subunit